jgi:hypothetical protein
MKELTNRRALDIQFRQDKLDGMTLSIKFSDWLSEQSETRLDQIQLMEVVDVVAEIVKRIDGVIKVSDRLIDQPMKITKASIARIIFEEEYAVGLVRKVVLFRFMDEAGLTAAGANTYYNNLRKSYGLVLV